jgi:hypothetical protein
MATAEATRARFCANCGAALSGKFCSDCGTPAGNAVTSTDQEGWSGLTSELLDRRGGASVLGVALSFLRHPIATIIRLTDDPTYRSHWRFLAAVLGAQLTLVHVILPRLYAALFDVPDTANTSAVLTNEIVQYAGMAILTPIQYYVCRALGSRRRTPLSYVKLCVLSVGYGALLSFLAALVFFATGVAAVTSGTAVDLQIVWQGLLVGVLVAVLVFVTASHRRFWGMSWPIAISVTLGAAALSWLVVYPALTNLAEGADIAGTIKRFLG